MNFQTIQQRQCIAVGKGLSPYSQLTQFALIWSHGALAWLRSRIQEVRFNNHIFTICQRLLSNYQISNWHAHFSMTLRVARHNQFRTLCCLPWPCLDCCWCMRQHAARTKRRERKSIEMKSVAQLALYNDLLRQRASTEKKISFYSIENKVIISSHALHAVGLPKKGTVVITATKREGERKKANDNKYDSINYVKWLNRAKTIH